MDSTIISQCLLVLANKGEFPMDQLATLAGALSGQNVEVHTGPGELERNASHLCLTVTSPRRPQEQAKLTNVKDGTVLVDVIVINTADAEQTPFRPSAQASRRGKIRTDGQAVTDGAPLDVRALEKLTGAEQKVLRLLAEGLSTKQIATKLFVSPRTIDTHRSQICRKLDIHSVAELTRFAIRTGLTPL